MKLVLELSDNEEAALNAKARASGVSAEQYAKQVLERELAHPTPSAGRPIACLPEDGARQVDHYIYGLPKRTLKLPARDLGDMGSLHRRDIYDDGR